MTIVFTKDKSNYNLFNFACMKVSTNLLKDVKGYYLSQLEGVYGREEAESLINILIKEFFGLSRAGQALNPDFRLNETELLKIHFAVKELKNEKPVQYITGKTEFYELEMKVDENVLIPRPETEELVDEIKKEYGKSFPENILDIGTGSGCIALALKKIFPRAKVVAIDVSNEALEIAKGNALTNNLDISLKKKDILDDNDILELGSFDLIVSNPPYVTESDKSLMKKNVLQYEPHIALFVKDDNPLIFYEAISNFALNNLSRGGQLWFEINEKYGNEITGLLKGKGFHEITLKKDLFGKNRFLKCKK